MPRLPTIRVTGSHTISTTSPLAIPSASLRYVVAAGWSSYAQVFFAPVSSSLPGLRHDGSVSVVFMVKLRRPRMTAPYAPEAAVETLAPGGSSMNGMNLSGKPGIVQPMQMPPTFGHPPTPLIQPRLGTLHLTTGPQQPSFTRHFGDPYSVAKSPCS